MKKNQSRSQPVPEFFDLTNIYRRSKAGLRKTARFMRLVSLQVRLPHLYNAVVVPFLNACLFLSGEP